MTVIQKSTFKKFKRKKKATVQEDAPPPPIPELDDILTEMSSIKEGTKAEADRFHLLEAKAIQLMRLHKRDTYAGRTLVESSVAELNLEKFRSLVTSKQWDAVTRRTLDSDLLKAAVERKIIDAELVKKCTTMKPRKAYIRGT